MEVKKKFISELKIGEKVDDIFIVTKARQGSSKNGPYWDLEFQDKTGRIPAKIWYPQSGQYDTINEESFVKVRGYVDSFRNNLQIIVQGLKVVVEDEIDIEDFIPTTKIPPEKLMNELEELCFKNLKYRPWNKLIGMILKDKDIRQRFMNAPAAKSIHHAYRGGLLEHTLNVCKLCLNIAELYPEIDREILLVGAVLHDIGKIEEFEGKISLDYTDKGQLIGHVVMSVLLIEPFLNKIKGLSNDLIMHLKHIILSHHGEYEFGSPKRPKTREALIVHFADNIDAKLNMVGTLIDDMEDEQENWSKYQRFLERKIFRPVHTNEFIKGAKEKKRRSIEGCSLPLKE
ncbi:CRISPR-associated endonuclease Cas3'' [Desulfothermus sp.]